MRTSAHLVLAAAIGLASTPAWAIPALNGKYTGAGTEICQVEPGVNKGKTIQHMGTLTLTSTATGATGTYARRFARGSVVDRTTPMALKAEKITMTITVSGSANPYAITVAGTAGTASVSHTGYVQFDQVVSGVARRATIVTLYRSGDTTTADCSMQMTLTAQ